MVWVTRRGNSYKLNMPSHCSLYWFVHFFLEDNVLTCYSLFCVNDFQKAKQKEDRQISKWGIHEVERGLPGWKWRSCLLWTKCEENWEKRKKKEPISCQSPCPRVWRHLAAGSAVQGLPRLPCLLSTSAIGVSLNYICCDATCSLPVTTCVVFFAPNRTVRLWATLATHTLYTLQRRQLLMPIKKENSSNYMPRYNCMPCYRYPRLLMCLFIWLPTVWYQHRPWLSLGTFQAVSTLLFPC